MASISPAAMFIRLSDPSLTAALVRFLHQREYLAIAHDQGVVEALPLNAVSARGDRMRLNGELAAWRRHHREVETELVEEPRPRFLVR